eukprot:SAG31_NODE_5320_length_2613_cov_1.238663_2_plen_167_part_00
MASEDPQDGGVTGQTMLADYMQRILLVNATTWEKIATRTIADVVRLTHLRCLMMAIEERTHGSKLDTVLLMYREDLASDLRAELRMAAPALRLTELLPILRDFMVDQLTTDNCPADASLKEYLEYASTTPLEEEAWYIDYFPDRLQIQHAWAVFKHLTIERNGVTG